MCVWGGGGGAEEGLRLNVISPSRSSITSMSSRRRNRKRWNNPMSSLHLQWICPIAKNAISSDRMVQAMNKTSCGSHRKVSYAGGGEGDKV